MKATIGPDTVATGDTASAVRSTPVASQGWRPISVTYQPASVAAQPEKVIATSMRASQRGTWPRRHSSSAPSQDTASISRPRPTMTRKAKKTGATGGCRPA